MIPLKTQIPQWKGLKRYSWNQPSKTRTKSRAGPDLNDHWKQCLETNLWVNEARAVVYRSEIDSSMEHHGTSWKPLKIVNAKYRQSLGFSTWISRLKELLQLRDGSLSAVGLGWLGQQGLLKILREIQFFTWLCWRCVFFSYSWSHQKWGIY